MWHTGTPLWAVLFQQLRSPCGAFGVVGLEAGQEGLDAVVPLRLPPLRLRLHRGGGARGQVRVQAIPKPAVFALKAKSKHWHAVLAFFQQQERGGQKASSTPGEMRNTHHTKNRIQKGTPWQQMEQTGGMAHHDLGFWAPKGPTEPPPWPRTGLTGRWTCLFFLRLCSSKRI